MVQAEELKLCQWKRVVVVFLDGLWSCSFWEVQMLCIWLGRSKLTRMAKQHKNSVKSLNLSQRRPTTQQMWRYVLRQHQIWFNNGVLKTCSVSRTSDAIKNSGHPPGILIESRLFQSPVRDSCRSLQVSQSQMYVSRVFFLLETEDKSSPSKSFKSRLDFLHWGMPYGWLFEI